METIFFSRSSSTHRHTMAPFSAVDLSQAQTSLCFFETFPCSRWPRDFSSFRRVSLAAFIFWPAFVGILILSISMANRVTTGETRLRISPASFSSLLHLPETRLDPGFALIEEGLLRCQLFCLQKPGTDLILLDGEACFRWDVFLSPLSGDHRHHCRSSRHGRKMPSCFPCHRFSPQKTTAPHRRAIPWCRLV